MPPSRAGTMETTLGEKNRHLMDKEAEDLLRKGSIESCCRVPGFYSKVFLVQKKGGKLRPITNLEP